MQSLEVHRRASSNLEVLTEFFNSLLKGEKCQMGREKYRHPSFQREKRYTELQQLL